MNKLTREQFLALPAGTFYLDQNPGGTGPAIKGDTADGGSFWKQAVRPTDSGKLRLAAVVDRNRATTDVYVLDEVETLACKELLYKQLSSLTLPAYLSQALRFLEAILKADASTVVVPKVD